MGKGGHYSFPWIALLTLDLYLIMLCVKQGGIKYHFWVFGMTRLGIESQVSQAIGEYSTHLMEQYFKWKQPSPEFELRSHFLRR